MNFKQIITDLKSWGLRQSEIARQCECSKVTIHDLAKGKTQTPGFDLGSKLIDLHKRISRKKA